MILVQRGAVVRIANTPHASLLVCKTQLLDNVANLDGGVASVEASAFARLAFFDDDIARNKAGRVRHTASSHADHLALMHLV